MLSARKANLIVGNSADEAVIELHFPASSFLFERSSVFALTGADFSAAIDGHFIPLNKPIAVAENSILRFKRPVSGTRSYLSVSGGFEIPKWLNSYSTNFKAGIGGMHGSRLRKDDVIPFQNKSFKSRVIKELLPLTNAGDENLPIMFLPGNEWDWLSATNKDDFLKPGFTISHQADRMGYRLSGKQIYLKEKMDLVSSPVSFGTIQLLPDGNLILLMADHQTTGGYPRIGTVISAHHSILAQKRPGDQIHFELTDILTAEKLLFHEEEELLAIDHFFKNNFEK